MAKRKSTQLIQAPTYYLVKVRFQRQGGQYSANSYTYKTTHEEWTKPNLFVVVDSPNTMLTIVKVIESCRYQDSFDAPSLDSLKDILGSADLTEFFAQEYARHRKQEILQRLIDIKKSQEERDIYRILSRVSPEAKALLKELETLE
jgi:hypothetical protein